LVELTGIQNYEVTYINIQRFKQRDQYKANHLSNLYQ